MSKSPSLIQFLSLVFLVIFAVPIIGMSYNEASKMLGLRQVPVPVVGTGSMYPSLFWSTTEGGPEDESKVVVQEYRTTPHLYRLYPGFKIFNQIILSRSVGYGDLVSFKNDKTAEILQSSHKDPDSGFIKRIIGLPGDKIELRDGFVYKNAKLLSEPYISSPRSTYGGTTLKECREIIIPEGSYFVLGDNRKLSSDSRFELGLIRHADIDFILPYSEQNIYRSLWRDPSKDSELLGQPTLDTKEFMSLVGELRAASKLPQLIAKEALVKSSVSRGKHLLEDEKTNYDLKQATQKAGYHNIVLGEFVSYGHYTAKELLDNLLYNSAGKQILNPDFTDLGVADVGGEVDGCPSHIIVGHLGGYIPASYDAQTVKSWHDLHDNLVEVIPSWESAKDYGNIDQAKLISLLSILYRRVELASEVMAVMDKSQWLSEAQQSRIKADEQDAERAQILSKELNKD